MQTRNNPQQSFYETIPALFPSSEMNQEDSFASPIQASLNLFDPNWTYDTGQNWIYDAEHEKINLLEYTIRIVKHSQQPIFANTKILNAIFEILFLYQAFLRVKYKTYKVCYQSFKKENPYAEHVLNELNRLIEFNMLIEENALLKSIIKSIKSPREFEAAQIKAAQIKEEAKTHNGFMRTKPKTIPPQKEMTKEEEKLDTLFHSIKARANFIQEEVKLEAETAAEDSPQNSFISYDSDDFFYDVDSEENEPKESTSYLRMACAGVALVVGIGACITGVGALIGVPLIIGSVSVLAGSLAVGIGGLLSIGSGGFLGHKAFSLFGRAHEPVASIEPHSYRW